MKQIIILIIIIVVDIKIVTSQEVEKIPTIIYDMQTSDTCLINYYNKLVYLKNNNLKNIKIALKYFNDSLDNECQYLKDSAALIFQNYYLKFKKKYNNKLLKFSNTSNNEIARINDSIAEFGFRLSLISESENMYLEPLPGFLPKEFEKVVSNEILEYFKLYDIFLEKTYLRYNSGDLIEYVQLTEDLLLKTEKYANNYSVLNKDNYIDRFYMSNLIDYINLDDIADFEYSDTISGGKLTCMEVYLNFVKNNAASISGKFMTIHNKNILEKSKDIDYHNFFYRYDYNDFAIPEIRKDLKIRDVVFELKKYIEDSVK